MIPVTDIPTFLFIELFDQLKDNSRSVDWSFVSNYEQLETGKGIKIHQINRLAGQDFESVTRFTYLYKLV